MRPFSKAKPHSAKKLIEMGYDRSDQSFKKVKLDMVKVTNICIDFISNDSLN